MQVTASGHMLHAVRALLNLGWNVRGAPDQGRLQRNGQQMRLRWARREAAYRIFIYKITGSGRSEHERRIEITTTYQKGLARLAGYDDVVLGYEPVQRVFVGVDARRIEHGGKTGNASSFIDPEGLAQAADTKITILRRHSQLFGVEYHAYFKPARLAEYLVNAADIHRGAYLGTGDYSKNPSAHRRGGLTIARSLCGGTDLVMLGPASLRERTTFSAKMLHALEEGNSTELNRLGVTQNELIQLTARLQEIGLKGEEIVVKAEISRLRRARRADLAAKVSWVSQSRPFEGYDILSFEADGVKRFIEVKSTPRNSRRFPMTANEWRVASLKGNAYFIYRLTEVETSPKTVLLQNPIVLEKQGRLKRSPLAWIVSY